MQTDFRSVLLVDDEPRTLELLGALLRRQGFLVSTSSSIKDAIEQLRTGRFDAVVTDVVFDGRSSGREVLLAARKTQPDAVVIVMTGYPAIDAAVSAIKSGANDYVEKPVDGVLLAAKIDRALRERELEAENLEFAELVEILSRMVARTIERIDPYTAGHSERTRRYCDLVAREMGLDTPTREKLALAAVAHDYGKIYLDDLSFLSKPGPLSDDEYREVKRHAALGAQKLGDHARLRDVCQWVAEHHERWDGNGYPNRKRGEEISRPGRILCVVEVFDSLATARSYKEAWPLDRVLEYFRSERGKGFDPAVVDAFAPKLEQHGFEWLRQPALDRRAAGVA